VDEPKLLCDDGVDVREGPTLHKRMMQVPPTGTGSTRPYPRVGHDGDVLDARTADEHLELVRQWAGQVWTAWAQHHATVRGWVSHSRLR
jgi:hypothetical protein